MTATPMAIETYEGRLLTDFEFFSREVWKARGRDKHHPITDLEQDIMAWFANGPMYGGPAMRGILAFRFAAKTNLGTFNYALWRFYRNPEIRIIIVSQTAPVAHSMVQDIREAFIQLPFMHHMRPGNVSKTQDKYRDASSQFDIAGIKRTMHPSLLGVGILNQLTGRRADLILPDDIESEVNTVTPTGRAKIRQRVLEFTNVATFGDREIVVAGTYHHEDSVYLHLPTLGYELRSYPLLAPHREHKIHNLAPYVTEGIRSGRFKPCSEPMSWDGTCIAAPRLDEKYVRTRVKSGHRNFGMQHMLLIDVGQSMKHPLRLDDLIVWNVDRDRAPISITYGKFARHTTLKPTLLDHIMVYHGFQDGLYAPIEADPYMEPYTGTKAGLDPSQGGDPMGLSIVSHLNGWLYVKAVVKLPGTSTPDNLLRIARLLRQHMATELWIESNNGGENVARLLEPLLVKLSVSHGGKDDEGVVYPDGWHCAVYTKHNVLQKEVRILNTLSPPSQSHRIVVDESVAADAEFQKQWTMLTNQRQCLEEDDLIDSLAQAIEPWGFELTIDSERAAERQRQEVEDERLAELQGRSGWRKRDKAHRYFKHRHF